MEMMKRLKTRFKTIVIESKVSDSGNISIPKEIAKTQGIKPGSKIVFVEIDGALLIQNMDSQPVERAMEALQRIGKV